VFSTLQLLAYTLAAAAADAGADFKSFRQPSTGYSLVQAAADKGHFEAVVKLVEAGASWRLPKRGQEFVGCPDFDLIGTLAAKKPGLKVGTCGIVATPTHRCQLQSHLNSCVASHCRATLFRCNGCCW
jgi:hypothetical protein